MQTKYYKCRFLSDVVLPASSNTQGNIALNDFIAGSNFLGMVAKEYDSFGKDAFSVFHSGDVRFGDGHILINEKASYKIPLSFHKLKVGEGVFNRVHLTQEDEKNLRNEQKQLKQMRNGYINEDFELLELSYNYTQKSSYDKELRRSKDEGMYGYFALQSGTEWLFKVTYKDDSLVEAVEYALLGKQYLGKSKSAQYGEVEITPYNHQYKELSFIPKDDLTYIYVKSRLALLDEDGHPTAVPTIENLGLSSGEIVWEKTYIRTSTYTPYNYKRATQEYTRIVINKGSLITVKGCNTPTQDAIGAYINEGFGEVLINPAFLQDINPNLKKYEEEEKQTSLQKGYFTPLLAFLENKAALEEEKFAVAQHVQQVYKNFIKPSKSQWGQIRTFASIAKDAQDLKNKIKEYISKGVAKKQWEGLEEKLFSEIDSSKSPLAFVKLLAMIVAKHTEGGKDGK